MRIKINKSIIPFLHHFFSTNFVILFVKGSSREFILQLKWLKLLSILNCNLGVSKIQYKNMWSFSIILEAYINFLSIVGSS